VAVFRLEDNWKGKPAAAREPSLRLAA